MNEATKRPSELASKIIFKLHPRGYPNTTYCFSTLEQNERAMSQDRDMMALQIDEVIAPEISALNEVAKAAEYAAAMLPTYEALRGDNKHNSANAILGLEQALASLAQIRKEEL